MHRALVVFYIRLFWRFALLYHHLLDFYARLMPHLRLVQVCHIHLRLY